VRKKQQVTLFRSSDNDFASILDGDQPTSEVIVNTFMEIGLDEMVGKDLAFINFDRNLILANYCECLPRERVVLEIPETCEPDAVLSKDSNRLK
jgi:EAL and modified HD-GYP domain-containing signal transduction protein